MNYKNPKVQKMQNNIMRDIRDTFICKEGRNVRYSIEYLKKVACLNTVNYICKRFE
jgi:hypothetical protein